VTCPPGVCLRNPSRWVHTSCRYIPISSYGVVTNGNAAVEYKPVSSDRYGRVEVERSQGRSGVHLQGHILLCLKPS